MTRMHPTTWAIASGLKGAELPSQDRLAVTAFLARQLADDHALPERERIVDAAEAGWDLGIRTRGDFGAEVTASRVLETAGCRLIVTTRPPDNDGLDVLLVHSA